MKVFKPPTPPECDGPPVVFLAGTIDNGASIDWQSAVTEQLADCELILLNPRRDEWDSRWENRITFAPFREQVEWELDGLARADIILIHFASGSQSPISLLELGLHAQSGRVVISCAADYWRRGNIEVVSHRYGIPLFDTLGEAVALIRQKIG